MTTNPTLSVTDAKNRLYKCINYIQMLKGYENISFAIKEMIPKLKFDLTTYKTSYTDCIKNVFISYDHINLPAKQLAFIVCHEICHVLFIHGMRFKNLPDFEGDYSHHKWGIATDLFINTMLLKYCSAGSLEVPIIKKLDLKTGKTKDFTPLFFNKPPYPLPVEEIIYHNLQSNEYENQYHPEFNSDPDSQEDLLDIGIIRNYVNKIVNAPNTSRDYLLERLQEIVIPKHKNQWERKLRCKLLKTFSSKYKSDYNRNNRRNTSIYFAPEYVKIKEEKPRFLFAIDSSGSISGDQLGLFKGEILRVFSHGAHCDLISCHTKVHDVITKATKKQIENYKISESGGTFFDPVFEFAKNSKLKYDYIVYLTDGQGGFNHFLYREFKKKTIWLLNNMSKDEKFNKKIEDNFKKDFQEFGTVISIN